MSDEKDEICSKCGNIPFVAKQTEDLAKHCKENLYQCKWCGEWEVLKFKDKGK